MRVLIVVLVASLFALLGVSAIDERTVEQLGPNAAGPVALEAGDGSAAELFSLNGDTVVAEPELPVTGGFADHADELTAEEVSATSVPVVDLPTVVAPEAALMEATGPLPVRVRVDRMGLDAVIVPVGVDQSGDFDVPGPQLVGWYEHGVLPGHEGSSVLAAHVDFGRKPGAFRQLEVLLPGDSISVDFDDGTTLDLEVTDTALFDKVALPASELFRELGSPVIRLVTCGGAFDAAIGHYYGNRVVSAIPV